MDLDLFVILHAGVTSSPQRLAVHGTVLAALIQARHQRIEGACTSAQT